jgi:hypothetical protein
MTLECITHPRLTSALDITDFPENLLSIYHTNIHSLPHKYLLLTEHLSQYNNTPAVIALSENQLTNQVNQHSYSLNGYTHIHKEDISVYYNESMHITHVDDITIPQVATIIIQVHEDKMTTNPTHTIINLYRRPRPNTELIKDLQEAIDTILTRHPETEITFNGDLNINILNLNPSHHFTTFLLENNLHTTITTPTRHDPHHNTATQIDVILTTYIHVDVTSGTISPPLSDHLQTYAIFHKPVKRQSDKKIITLSTAQYEKNKTEILKYMQQQIQKITDLTDSNIPTTQHFHDLQENIRSSIEKFQKKTKGHRKPWCKPKVKKMIRKQHLLHKLRIKEPTAQNIAKHTIYRNKLNKKIKKEKREFLTKQIESAKHDPKRQAKILKTIIPRKSQTRTSPTTIKYEGKTYTKPNDIADALNDHFITIGHKTSKKIIQEEEEIQDEGDRLQPPFELRKITLEEVEKTMKKINPNKASDIYKIKPAIIKDLTPFIAPILTLLFNRSIEEHNYPDSLKITKLIELYKAKEKDCPANYRPISLLPIIAKILDVLINNQVMAHLTEHNIISPTQYAFRPNSNTTLALQTILNRIHKHKSNRQPLLAIYIDLSKAYDTISHDKLIRKLQHDFNFTEGTTEFFRSYLQRRTASLHTQHAQSATKTITHGIPQGSTLSTTLFLLYINDIIKTTPKSKVFTYADDTTLIITADNTNDLQKLAESELANLVKYFYTNNLIPNPTKTEYTIFYPQKLKSINLKVNKEDDKYLKHTKTAKLLGLLIQKNMKYNETITQIIKKLQPIMHSFKYAKKFLPTQIMRNLYYSLIHPHFMLNMTIWGTENDKKTYIQPLIRIQKRIIRLMVNTNPRAHTKPIMTKHKIMNLTNLYIYQVCIGAHPFIHPQSQLNRPEHDHEYIWTAQIHNYPTRHTLDKHIYIPNTSKNAKHTIGHLTAQYARIWNSLPSNIRDIRSKDGMKKALKNYLLEKQKNNNS